MLSPPIDRRSLALLSSPFRGITLYPLTSSGSVFAGDFLFFSAARGLTAVGGWKDIGTLLKCYTQADNDTMLAVMESSKKVTERAVSG